MDTASPKTRFAPHGYAGIAIIVAAEALLFGGNQLVGHWFTPIVWTGYILSVDAIVYNIGGRSLLMNQRVEFIVIILISIGAWWLFEFYNAPRFWKSDIELWWHYHNLEPNFMLRRVGYDWAFATIFPLLFITAELFAITIFKHSSRGKAIRLSKTLLIVSVAIGAVAVIIPFLYPSPWFAPVVWFSFI